mmetsp:Transcript_10987/g.23522  ORF Transcript_10987/g.23522 Transcript_10987/m.23522 type:complete len:413 (+) Transcript_10987:52-1290(+)|eukprot:CAMPEP_0185851020 /NCGR_PEP_ID=MMETSP1354-20130828/5092_1 /TAXON_ID=708628 /ORGANISM="Erythrolobus madagascarensis, Strain CCMP3276" /LENGTH=412 /DNA_ID=CAMNT_0028551777 /DNA_START=31 /DNA_END=1269 /DNA_ORIENTATION=-
MFGFVGSSFTSLNASAAVNGAACGRTNLAPVGMRTRAVRHMRAGAPNAGVSMSAEIDWDAQGKEWGASQADPVEVLDKALEHFGSDLAIAFSGAEDVAVIEYAARTGKPFRVFALDTGRLHPETYRYYQKVEKHYGIKIEYTFPDSGEVEALVNEKGLFSFYEDGHQECCRVRKVRPLRKKLGTLRAWVTGQRKDQSPGTRTEVPTAQVDPAFQGTNEGPLVKFNPLANTSSADVWAMLRMVEVPYNELHEKGFVSIGCEPCTKPVLPNQHEREGRWWWEEATQKECGLHKGNIGEDAVSQEKADNRVRDLIASGKVVIFSKSTCPYCKELKALLNSLEVKYLEYALDIEPDGGDLGAALERLTAQSTVPNLFVGKKHIGTCDMVKKLHAEGKLAKVFSEVGITVKGAVKVA